MLKFSQDVLRNIFSTHSVIKNFYDPDYIILNIFLF